MARIRKKATRTRSVRLNLITDKMLDNYMKAHKGRFNESDLIDEAVACFFKQSECLARLQFEHKYNIKPSI